MLCLKAPEGHVILGIDAEELQQLKDGAFLQVQLPGQSGVSTIAVCYAETHEEIRAGIEDAQNSPLRPQQ